MNRKENKNKNEVKNSKSTASHQQPNIENVNKKNNKNRTLIVGFSYCGKIYLMNYIIIRKQEPIYIQTK